MEENNKLIAEFMGMTTHENDSSCMINKTDKGNEVIPIESMKYHNFWDDWLMPVVENIESNEKYDVEILQYGTRILENCKEIVTNVANISFDKKIDHTYHAVVEFIKWNNEIDK
jgi:hypothetical protein